MTTPRVQMPLRPVDALEVIHRASAARQAAAFQALREECRLSPEEAARAVGLRVRDVRDLEAGVRCYHSRAEWLAALRLLMGARRCAERDCPDRVDARDRCVGHRKQLERKQETKPKQPKAGRPPARAGE